MDTCAVGEPPDGKIFLFYLFILSWSLSLNYLFNYLPWTFTYLFLLAFYSPLVHFLEEESVRIPATSYFYSCLEILFHPYTVNILNVSYYLPIEKDLVWVGLMSKDQVLYKHQGLLKIIKAFF